MSRLDSATTLPILPFYPASALLALQVPLLTLESLQVAKHPEVRSLILSVAKTATGEGVRSSIFATRDLLLGEPRQVPYPVFPAQQGMHTRVVGDAMLQQPLSNRTLGTLLLFIFMPIIIFLAGRRAALA